MELVLGIMIMSVYVMLLLYHKRRYLSRAISTFFQFKGFYFLLCLLQRSG